MALSSLAYAEDRPAVPDGNKNEQAAITKVINAPNDTPLDQVPEPSTESMILIGVGGIGLAMKLRKRV
jgi:hypothetical protein